MNKSKSSILDVIGMGLLTLLFGGIAAANWMTGQILGGVLLALLTLLCLWSVFGDVKRGLRAPTHYEWFRLWMIARPVLVVGIGIAALLILLGGDPPRTDLIKGLLAGASLLWAGLVFYLIWQAPHRHEADAAYRQRVGYGEKYIDGD